MADIPSAVKTIYHVEHGPTTMYVIDAKTAVGNHPKEWSEKPWDGSDPIGVVIPGDWADLPASKRIALARELGAEGNLSGAKADEIITEYLDKQANPEA